MEKAVANSKAVIAGLESGQTILQQLFKTCTAHKMTHLFAADALKSDYDELPNNWNLYHDHGHCLQLHGRWCSLQAHQSRLCAKNPVSNGIRSVPVCMYTVIKKKRAH